MAYFYVGMKARKGHLVSCCHTGPSFLETGSYLSVEWRPSGLSDPPGYTPQCWSYRPMQTHPVFNVGSGDLNSCLASSFTC